MQLSLTHRSFMEHLATGCNAFSQSQVEQLFLIQHSKQTRHLLHLQLLGRTQIMATIT